ncbi:MAG: triose-phosphate isomerase [Bacteroidales bacterium]|nr:triose-phosphate isomerase [Bacteroidales bacterium]
MRKKVVAGNWKMNMELNAGLELAAEIKNYFKNKKTNADVVLCTPFIHLAPLKEILQNSNIGWGAQNCHSEPSGAFTGEISCGMIKSTGAGYVIIGHSERRTYFKEDDEFLNKKIKLAVATGLNVIFCCGEVLSERKSEIHFDVVKNQLEKGIFNLSKEEMKNVIIAYEPVWAIGTGLTATPAQAQEMHSYIRKLIAEKYGKHFAEETTILYGGSCKASNAKELFDMPDVDGGLIGGASLKKEEFCAIVEAIN